MSELLSKIARTGIEVPSNLSSLRNLNQDKLYELSLISAQQRVIAPIKKFISLADSIEEEKAYNSAALERRVKIADNITGFIFSGISWATDHGMTFAEARLYFGTDQLHDHIEGSGIFEQVAEELHLGKATSDLIPNRQNGEFGVPLAITPDTVFQIDDSDSPEWKVSSDLLRIVIPEEARIILRTTLDWGQELSE